MTTPDRSNHLDGPPRVEDMRTLHETRVPDSEQDHVRTAGFDPYSAPTLQMASSMTGRKPMQHLVALVLLLGLLLTIGLAFFS